MTNPSLEARKNLLLEAKDAQKEVPKSRLIEKIINNQRTVKGKLTTSDGSKGNSKKLDMEICNEIWAPPKWQNSSSK